MTSQPSLGEAYNVQGNPASKEPEEQSISQSGTGEGKVSERKPNDEYTPDQTATGVRGGGSGENRSDVLPVDKGESEVAEGRFGASGEGDIASAVKDPKKSGR